MCGFDLRSHEPNDLRGAQASAAIVTPVETRPASAPVPKPATASPTNGNGVGAATPPHAAPKPTAKPTPKTEPATKTQTARPAPAMPPTSPSEPVKLTRVGATAGAVATQPKPKPTAPTVTAESAAKARKQREALMQSMLLSTDKAKAKPKTKRSKRRTAPVQIHPISVVIALACVLFVGVFVMLAASRNSGQAAASVPIQPNASQALPNIGASTPEVNITAVFAQQAGTATAAAAVAAVAVEPTATPLPLPTDTPVPSATPQPTTPATDTPAPSITNTALPSATPSPVPSATPIPTNTPKPTATETPVPTPTLPVVTEVAPTAAPASSADVYVVRAGDNCYEIAQKLGVPLNDLLAANKLTVRCKLQIGDRLVVPGKPTATPDGPQPTATATVKPTTYLVRAGDTCLGIARKLGVDLDALASANNLRVSYCFIRPGDKLVVPQP